MATKDQSMEVQKQDEVPAVETERTCSQRTFVPRADIYETDKEIIVLADIPGANEKTVDITLGKNVLSINANIEPSISSGFDIAYTEYEEGDYQRSFRLAHEVDRGKIGAVVNQGVLRLHIPISQKARTKKIEVKPK